MIEGKEPMRTFGDLMQFMKVKQTPDTTEPPAQRKNGNAPPSASPAPTTPVSEPTTAVAPAASSPAVETSEAAPTPTVASGSATTETTHRTAGVPAPHTAPGNEHGTQSAVETQASEPSIP
jgi:hypothetical protein